MRRKSYLPPLLVLVLVLAALFPWRAVRANTYEVANTNASGPGSLRQAITDANNNPAPDTITFAATTNGTPIYISGAAGEDANASGDLDILDGGDLTIQGNGAGNTIINGAGVDRVMHICPAGSCTHSVTISGLAIYNGDAGIAAGGGIHNNGSSLTLLEVTIGGSGAGNTAGLGAGLYNSGIATVDGCAIRANTAYGGGGIYNEGTLTVQNSTIGWSGSDGNTAIDGGGIYNAAGGALTVDDCTVSGNTATDEGGGIYNLATLNIQNGSTIGGPGLGNSATNDGGGIYNQEGTITLSGSSVNANTATGDGGGIFNEATLYVLSGSTIGEAGAGNTADDAGGGIYNDVDGITTVDASGVSANTATRGGGILSSGNLTILNGSTIGQEGASNIAGDLGGGILSWGSATIESSFISNNTADYGGGIFNLIGTLTVDDSTVRANTAYEGGGIFNQATLNVQNGSIIGGAGAGNSAQNTGGGIFNDAGGSTMVSASLISGNFGAWRGGGIHNFGTLIVQNNSDIGESGAGNEAIRGGGIYNEVGTATVEGSAIDANSATFSGGGIFNDGTFTVTTSTINSNNADRDGGGIYNNQSGALIMDECTVAANTAQDGGGVYSWGLLTIQNGSTIGGSGSAGNLATNEGGGIYSEFWLTVDASIVSGNTANIAGGISSYGVNSSVTGSRILDNSAISTDGGGINVAGGDFSVAGSCIVSNSYISLFSNTVSEQIATGNWWGAPGGPNTPGADTTFGNLDVSGHLTAPILACSPDLQVSKANDTGGNGTVDTPFQWTLTVANTGPVDALFHFGQTILVDDLPTGATYGTSVIGGFVDIDNPANIQCNVASNTLTCTAAGGDVTLEDHTGSFQVTLTVTPNTPGTFVNPTGVCRVDPDGNVTENDETNNDCPANVVNITTDNHYSYLPMVLRDSNPEPMANPINLAAR